MKISFNCLWCWVRYLRKSNSCKIDFVVGNLLNEKRTESFYSFRFFLRVFTCCKVRWTAYRNFHDLNIHILRALPALYTQYARTHTHTHKYGSVNKIEHFNYSEIQKAKINSVVIGHYASSSFSHFVRPLSLFHSLTSELFLSKKKHSMDFRSFLAVIVVVAGAAAACHHFFCFTSPCVYCKCICVFQHCTHHIIFLLLNSS